MYTHFYCFCAFNKCQKAAFFLLDELVFILCELMLIKNYYEL